MRTIEEIKQSYAEHCARLGDLVIQQRRLHDAAEHVINLIGQLDQEARGIQAATAPIVEAPVASQEQ